MLEEMKLTLDILVVILITVKSNISNISKTLFVPMMKLPDMPIVLMIGAL